MLNVPICSHLLSTQFVGNAEGADKAMATALPGMPVSELSSSTGTSRVYGTSPVTAVMSITFELLHHTFHANPEQTSLVVGRSVGKTALICTLKIPGGSLAPGATRRN